MATVVDSRATDLGQAWKNMEGSRSPHEPVYRLVVAEDLPEERISLLEGVLNGDRRVLLDHAANKSFPNQGWDEHRLQNPKTEFYANLSELPETMSIALPYEIQARPIASGGVYTRLVERSVAKVAAGQMSEAIESLEKRAHALSTSWLRVPHLAPDIQHVLWVSYRRTSLQFIPSTSGEPPTCGLLDIREAIRSANDQY